jgi:small-conductance mechanosensitive channel
MDWLQNSRLQDFLALFGSNPLLRALVLVVLSLVVAKIADAVFTRVLKLWAKKSKTDLDDRLVEILHRPVFVSVVLVGLWLATLQLALPEVYQETVLRLLKTVGLWVWVVFALRASSLILDALSRMTSRMPQIDIRTLPLFENTAKILILGTAVYFLFLSWGIDVGVWLMSAGVVGIAVGFAAKDTLANLFSGFFIMADMPYKEGDFIILDSGERGEVSQIGLRSTRLLTRDDIEVTIPNAVIANAKITNETGGPWEKERVRLKVGVAYGSDIDHVKEVLMEVAIGLEHICADPAPRVRFRGFGDSSLDLELMGWIDEPILRGRVLDALYTEVYKRFAKEGIEIPFPQRDIHLQQPSNSE